MNFKVLLLLIFIVIFSNSSKAQQVISFEVSGKKYELIRETKTWEAAATVARSKGAHLAKINSAQEQNGIWQKLQDLGARARSNRPQDGGGAYYVWLGGNDISNEGDWIWDGDNLNGGLKFWNDNSYGYSVGDQYNNWGRSSRGNEPDDYLNNQDGLAIALTNWPMGSAGQWNDINISNRLYFLIEYDNDVYEYDFERNLQERGWIQQRVGNVVVPNFKWKTERSTTDAKHGNYYALIMHTDANDWMVSDKIKLKKGKYNISFWISGNAPKMRIGVGTTQSYTSMKIIKEKIIRNTRYELIEANYIAKNYQSVYIGIHSLLRGTPSALMIDYFRIRKLKNRAPVANTGNNIITSARSNVELNGTASNDPDGDKLTYLWEAPSDVRLTNADNKIASFTAPDVTVRKTINIKLTVSDGLLSHSKNIIVTVNPAKRDQTITFPTIPNKIFGDADFNLQANSNSRLTVTYTVQGPATITNNRLHITGAGRISVTAKQTGNSNYNAATAITRSFTVAKAAQTINFETIPNKTFGDANFNLQAISNSGLAVFYTVQGPATITDNRLHITGAGRISVTAKQTGNANYNAATAITRSFTVAKAAQTINFETIPNKTFGDANFNLQAISNSGLAVFYTVQGPATITDNRLHITGAGRISVTAKQTGNANYNAATAITRSFTVTKAEQRINFPEIPNKTIDDADFNLQATSSSGLAVSYTVQGPATITGKRIHLTGVGNVSITAKQIGNSNYNSAPNVVRNFKIEFATGIQKPNEKSIAIYPNPIKDVFYIKSPINKTHKLYIYNSLGKKLKDEIILKKEVGINISNLPSGVYIIIIYVDDLKITKRIIKK